MPGAKARLRLDGADPINRGLLRYFPLDEGAGPLRDISAYRRGGATVGATTRPVTSRGRALGVSTGSNYGSVSTGPVVAGLVNWTIALQIQVASGFNATDGAAFYCERAASGNDILKMEGLGGGAGANKAFFTLRNDAGTLLQGFGTVVINDGLWHDLVLVKRGTSIIYYVDGKADINSTWSGADTFTDANRSTLGVDLVASGTAFTTGNMRGLRLYSRALLPQEVQRLRADPWAGTDRRRRTVVYAPGGGITLTPGAGAATYTGQAVTVSAGATVAVGAGAETYAGQQASVTAGATVAVGAGAVSYQGQLATVSEPITVAVGPGAVSYEGQGVTFSTGQLGGTLRRHRRSVRWDDVPLELEPVVALAENYAGAADVQRAVDDALLRFARIGARTSVNRRATLIDEMRRAVVAAVERAAEDDDEEALAALL